MRYNEEYIVNEYTKGRHTNEIAKELRTYNTTIRRILLRNKVELRGIGLAQRLLKDNPFMSNADYWLGLLATDGCNTKGAIILELQEQDRHILEDYQKFLGGQVNINTTNHKASGKILYRISFRNSEVTSYLSNLGITPRKSWNLELKIPITWDMFRGIFDGDGCISNARCSSFRFSIATKSEKFAQQLSNFLTKEDVYNNIWLNKKSDLYFVNVNRMSESIKIYKKMYYEDCICLTRKYNKFGYLIQKWNEKNLAKTGKVSSTNPVLASNRALQRNEVTGQV